MDHFPSVLASINDLENSQVKKLFSFKNNSPENTNQLNNPIIATIFFENSTRTKLSFEIAAKKLGLIHIDFNPETSSLKKGEDFIQCLHTLKQQGVEVAVIRTGDSSLFQKLKKASPVKIINAGDGINEHPTQALVDLYTIQKLKSKKIKKLTIIGDLRHSRVANSLILLLPRFDIEVSLCAPKELLPSFPLPSEVKISNNLNQSILQSDALYLLRMQKERHLDNEGKINIEEYITNYGLTLEKLVQLKKEIPVFHPGPANIGIEIDKKLIESDLFHGHLQVKNSIYIRQSILNAMLSP